MSLRRNTLINLVGQLLALAISLAAVPPLLRLVGNGRYGVLLVVWVLLGYFALFDLGVSQATTQRMATLRYGPPRDRSQLVWTALVMNITMGLVAGAVLFLAGHLVLGRFMTMQPHLRMESLRALPWIALALPVSMAASIFSSALQGQEAFAATTTASTLSQGLAQGLPLYVAWNHSISLEWLIPAALAARLVSGVVLYAMCRRLVPLVGVPGFDRASAQRLFKYGSWITISSVVGPLMSSMDRVLIGGISGSEAVTYYGVPQGLAGRLLILPSSLSGVLLPRLAATREDAQGSLASTSIRAIASIMTPCILLGMFLVGPFLSAWIGPSFGEVATPGAQVLLAGVWFNGMAMMAHSSLLARGRPDVVAKLHLIELPMYLGVLAGSLYLWGVTGAAIAWSLRVAVDAFLLYAAGGFLRSSWAKLLGPISLLGTALVVLRLQARMPELAWIGGGVLAILAVAWSYRNLPWKLFP